MPSIERCELAPGLSISRVLTGLWQVADMERGGKELNPRAAASAMTPYLDAGLTSFDMADHYGSAEIIAGTFRSELAGERPVELFTKWVPAPGPITRAGVREAVQRSLDRLQAERIDLLQFHSWNYADLSYLDALTYLSELREEGLIAHLGLTNFDTAHLRIVRESGIEVVSNQVSFSLLDQRAAGQLSDYCRARSVKLLAYGTLAGGLLTDRWLGVPDPGLSGLATWSQHKYKRFLDTIGGWDVLQALLSTLAKLGRERGCTIASLATRYILAQPAVGGIIIGARIGESEHIADSAALCSEPLDSAAHETISAALQDLRSVPGDCGDEYRRPPFLTASGDLSHHLDSFRPLMEPIALSATRTAVSSGTEWERLAGYSRAVRDGERILVSGTTATHGALGGTPVGGDDPAAQTHFVIDKIEGALQSLGGRLEDVVRTRIYVANMEDWEPVARAHGERFAQVLPANTLVQARLVGERYRVEIEAEASVGESRL